MRVRVATCLLLLLGCNQAVEAPPALAPVAAPRVEFEFVSLDGAPKDVAAFREQHWAMPWTHAFVGAELRNGGLLPALERVLAE